MEISSKSGAHHAGQDTRVGGPAPERLARAWRKRGENRVTHVHAMQHELGDEPPVLLLRVAEQRQGAIVELHDVLASVLADEHLDGAEVEAAELRRHRLDPAAVLVRHGRLFEHGRSQVRLPVAGYRFAPIVMKKTKARVVIAESATKMDVWIAPRRSESLGTRFFSRSRVRFALITCRDGIPCYQGSGLAGALDLDADT